MENYSLYGLPKDVIFCLKCTISNQRPSSVVEFKSLPNQKKPGIKFIKNICEACKYNEIKKNIIDWDKRQLELEKKLNRYRKKNGYDCIVPGSGGKDSAYTSHVLKYKYGMNPLTVTWAPHSYTNVGWDNFCNWTKVGGVDNVLYTPNGKLHRYLTKISFLNLLHPFQPFIIGQKIIGPLMAEKFKIPLIFYGENQAEYGNSINDNYVPTMKEEYFTISNYNNIILGGLTLNKIIKTTDFKLKEFQPYIPLKKKDFMKLKIEKLFLGYYLKWDPQECFYYSVKNTGFKTNEERIEGTYSKYSSIDDKIDPFHYFTTYIKFGIGRATYDTAQEIRNEKITREEGVNLVNKFDHEFPKKYFNEFLEYIDIDEMLFWKTIDRFRSPHLWGRKKNIWFLKKKIS